MKSLRCAVFAAAAALFVATPAQAATASASATVGPLTITLTDLIPTDGIAPALTLINGPSSPGSVANTAAYFADGVTSESFNERAVGASSFGPVSAKSITARSSGHSAVGGNGSVEGAAFAASGSAELDSLPSKTTPGGSFFIVGAAVEWAPFIVGAGTRAVISAPVALKAEVTGQIELQVVNIAPAYSSAFAVLQMVGSVFDGCCGPGTGDELWVSTVSRFDPSCTTQITACYGPDSASANDILQVSFENWTHDDLNAYFRINIIASGSITPIPEPGTCAMVIAGLLGIGYQVRRRRA
jgi:hypothetical protein